MSLKFGNYGSSVILGTKGNLNNSYKLDYPKLGLGVTVPALSGAWRRSAAVCATDGATAESGIVTHRPTQESNALIYLGNLFQERFIVHGTSLLNAVSRLSISSSLPILTRR